VLSFAADADQVLVVTTPEPTAITDAYAVIKALRRERDRLDIRILVNMVQSPSEGREVFNRLDAVCRRFLSLNVRYAGHVMHDMRVGQAVRGQLPFVIGAPGCPASNCIGELAHRMDRHAAESCGRGLFSRFAHWLAG